MMEPVKLQRNPATRVVDFHFQEAAVGAFLEFSKDITVNGLEFVPFKRFLAAGLLDRLCENRLQGSLNQTLQDYETGCVQLHFGEGRTKQDYIRLSAAVSHLINRPIPEPGGRFYGITRVVHAENPEIQILNPYADFTLHTDGVFLDQPVDWLMMMKLSEEHSEGGESRLLHLADWADFEKFHGHPMNRKKYAFGLLEHDRRHEIFSKVSGMKPARSRLLNLRHGMRHIKFVDQFLLPDAIEEALFIKELQDSLETSPAITASKLPVGSMIILNNNFWLHGRSSFKHDPRLSRELLRQYGYFRDHHDHYEEAEGMNL